MNCKSILRALGVVPTATLLTGATLLSAAGALILHEMRWKEPEEAPEYLIVLGARVHGEEPGEALKSRIEMTRVFLIRHPDTIAVLSGGVVGDAQISEAECMHRALIRAGIHPGRLITETQAGTTDENLLYSLMLIPDGATVGVLSNDFHAFRIKRFMKRCGYEAPLYLAKCPRRIFPLTFLREEVAVIVWAVTGKL